jgi:hypothetical protein
MFSKLTSSILVNPNNQCRCSDFIVPH